MGRGAVLQGSVGGRQLLGHPDGQAGRGQGGALHLGPGEL